MAFQTAINLNPPLAVEGNFASVSNTHNVLAGSFAFTAGATGVVMGRFAYADTATGKVTNAQVAGGVIGFVRRGDNTALVTNYLAGASMTIPAGYGVTLYDRGDFWVKTTTVATVGQKVFASDTTGEIATGAAGATVAGFTETEFEVASAGAVGSLIKIFAF